MDYIKLITPTTLKVLDVFKKEKIYFNQIAEIARIKSKSNLLAALERLVKMNVLKREETKGNTFYTLNYDNGVSLSLLGLLCTFKLYALPFERRKAIETIIQQARPHILFLFGSTAKGTFSKESDIDVLFVYEGQGDIREIEAVKAIGKKYGTVINPVYVQINELRHPIDSMKHILETGYPVAGHLHFYELYKRA